MVNTQSIFSQWDYAIDSSLDGVASRERPSVGGTTYEIYGVAVKQTADKVYFAVNANLPLEGQSHPRATDGVINWGDLILNFNGSSLNAANGNLVGIRFSGNNEADVVGTGIFDDVLAKSVVSDNVPYRGRDTLGGYNQLVRERGGIPSNGDLVADDPYFDLNEQIRNVIQSGNRLGDITQLSTAEMADLNFGTPGSQTFGFAVDRSLLPEGEFTMHLAPECGNDVVALKGKLFGPPGIDIEKKTNCVDVDAPENAIPLQPGARVQWTYEVKNTGDIPFTFDQVKVTDDKVAPVSFDASSDANQDRILSPDETWLYVASGFVEDLRKTSTPITKTVDLDFETDGAGNSLKAGEFIDDEYKEAYGLTISSLKISDKTEDPNHKTMIFDTANPTGDDKDLGSPHKDFGGPGESHDGTSGEDGGNRQPLSNVLIISQDNNPNDPNDKANGGVMRFDWEDPTQLNYIDILDVDKGDINNKIRTYNEQGNLIQEYSVPPKGDNSHQRIELGGELASRLEMIFDPSADGSASGAITNIGFTQSEYVYKNVSTVKVDGFKDVEDSDASYYRNGEAECICPPSKPVSSSDNPTQPPVGNDSLFKDDSLEGTSEQNMLKGCHGNDSIEGHSGDDLLWGGRGQDTGYGNGGNDQLWGRKGQDTVYGGNGNDSLWGGRGQDIVCGNDGDDCLWGRKGQDTVYGGDGNDQLKGGLGKDHLWGGKGEDQFLLSRNGLSIIQDFQLHHDVIALTGNMKFEDLSVRKQGSNTLIQFQDETVARFKEIAPSLITADSFVSI